MDRSAIRHRFRARLCDEPADADAARAAAATNAMADAANLIVGRRTRRGRAMVRGEDGPGESEGEGEEVRLLSLSLPSLLCLLNER